MGILGQHFLFLSYISDFLIHYFLDTLYLFIIINDYLHFSLYFRPSKILSDICGRRTFRGPSDVHSMLNIFKLNDKGSVSASQFGLDVTHTSHVAFIKIKKTKKRGYFQCILFRTEMPCKILSIKFILVYMMICIPLLNIYIQLKFRFEIKKQQTIYRNTSPSRKHLRTKVTPDFRLT